MTAEAHRGESVFDALVAMHAAALNPMIAKPYPEKGPRLPGWQRRIGGNALTLDEIREHCTAHPDTGCGLVHGDSGVICIDVDTAGPAALEAAVDLFGPCSRIEKTPSGGWHLFYRSREVRKASTDRTTLPGVAFEVRTGDQFTQTWPSPGYELVVDGPWQTLTAPELGRYLQARSRELGPTSALPTERTGEEKRRHQPDYPCPVCGGHANLKAGQGERCWGWTLQNAKTGIQTTFCSREELADGRPAVTDPVTGGLFYQHQTERHQLTLGGVPIEQAPPTPRDTALQENRDFPGWTKPPTAEGGFVQPPPQPIERLTLHRTAELFADRPRDREWIWKDLLPLAETGLLLGAGGTGKGHLTLHMACALALGTDLGGFRCSRPRGVALVSCEDDLEEQARRLWAWLDAHYPDPEEARAVQEILAERVGLVDLRGERGVVLSRTFEDALCDALAGIAPVGLVIVDPLARLLPPGVDLNSQDGAGLVVEELDALRTRLGATVLAVHHVNKESLRKDGDALSATAGSGSKLLTDLSRLVLNARGIHGQQAEEAGLDRAHNYLELAVSKANYSAPFHERVHFQRAQGGALRHVEASGKRTDRDLQVALRVLHEQGRWVLRDDWLDALRADGMSRDRARRAISELRDKGMLERKVVEKDRSRVAVFAPEAASRPVNFPSAPVEI